MKKWIGAIGICCLLLACSTLTITATAAEPTIRLPTSYVDINVEYGTHYYFDMAVSNIPPGYDLTNGNCHGWCVKKKSVNMNLSVPHQVILKSSNDYNNLSVGFQNISRENWNKINYIINNRGGYNRNDTQWAIWHYTDNKNVSGDKAQKLVNAADQNGTEFVPHSGQILAIPIDATKAIQLAFLELLIPGFEGFVWNDTGRNGLQNSNEHGMQGVTVRLFHSDSNLYKTTTTNSQGIYSFVNVPPGEYYLQFNLTGYKFTTQDVGQNVGINDTIDSDADKNTGKTTNFTILVNNETITIWDAGMYLPDSEITPTPPEDEEQSTNARPTADATAGEPYRGFINSNITFNGSKSYDRDGRIITWRWNFGDGTNGTGEIIKHKYTLPGNYTVSLLVTDNRFATDVYSTIAHITLGNNPPSVPVLSGPLSGHVSVSSQYSIVSTDPDGDNLRYIIDWGDGPKDTSPPIASGINIETSHQWNAAGFYKVQVYAQDPYNANSSIYTMTVSIDVHYAQNLGYFIDENGDGIFDKFHNNATGTETTVNQQTNGWYLIDSNGDGTFDLTYDTVTNQTQPYSEQPLLWYIIIILIILIIASLLIFYLMKKRKRSQE